MFDLDIPPAWTLSVENILQHRWRKILVLGATDRGKSTYCNLLAIKILSAGFRVAFVDADVGQKDVGPPATISLAYVKSEKGLTDAQIAGLYFAGAVSPAGHFLPIVVGTRRLVDMAQADHVIVDTTGLIHRAGSVLKSFQIDSIRPDAIIAIEKRNELETILNAYSHLNILRLSPSRAARSKSPKERKLLREKSFGNYFSGACELAVNIRELIFQRSPLFTGKRVQDTQYLYAEESCGGIVAVGSTVTTEKHRHLHLLQPGFEKNLLCALADKQGEVVGLGIMKRIDFLREQICVVTPVRREDFVLMQFGDMYISIDGRELPHPIKKGFY